MNRQQFEEMFKCVRNRANNGTITIITEGIQFSTCTSSGVSHSMKINAPTTGVVIKEHWCEINTKMRTNSMEQKRGTMYIPYDRIIMIYDQEI